MQTAGTLWKIHNFPECSSISNKLYLLIFINKICTYFIFSLVTKKSFSIIFSNLMRMDKFSINIWSVGKS